MIKVSNLLIKCFVSIATILVHVYSILALQLFASHARKSHITVVKTQLIYNHVIHGSGIRWAGLEHKNRYTLHMHTLYIHIHETSK